MNETLTNQTVEQQGVLGHLRQRYVALILAGALSPVIAGALPTSVSSAATTRDSPSAETLNSSDLLPSPTLNLGDTLNLRLSDSEISTTDSVEAESGPRSKLALIGRVASLSSTRSNSCVKYQDIMSPSEVENSVVRPTGSTGQSIVGAALGALKKVGKSIEYIGHQPGSPFGKEVDAYYRAKLGNSDELGTYVFEIDYIGKLTPKDVDSVQLEEVPGTFSGIFSQTTALYLHDRYDFWMSRGEYGNEGPKGINWSVSVNYGQKGNVAGSYALYSTLANGSEFGKPDLNLTPASLTSVGSQFIHLAKKAEAHGNIEDQSILPILKNERACQT